MHYDTYMWNLKKPNLIEIERRMVATSNLGMRKWRDLGQQVQTSSFKMNKLCGSNVHHGDYS